MLLAVQTFTKVKRLYFEFQERRQMKPTVYESYKYVIVSAIRKAAVGTCLLFATRAGADHLASIAKNWISVANLIETERGFRLRVPFFFTLVA